MQILQVIGNLGADAKIVDNGGRPFISFNVADTERWKDESGQDHERTTWISCAYNGDASTPVFPYLKKGTKVYVSGRQRTRVYSSEKERRMIAGVNLSVNHIELVGGNSDEIPRRLIVGETAEILPVYKAYYVTQEDMKKMRSNVLLDADGKQYAVAEQGWVTAMAQQEAAPAEQTTQQAEEQASQTTEQADQPFTGEDTELQNKVSSRGKKK